MEGDAARRPSPWFKGPIWAIPAIFVASLVVALPLALVGGDAALFLILAAAFLLWLWPIIVCFEKGRDALGFVGILIHVVSYWGAIRPAKPDSYYARTFYGDEEMREAIELYGEPGQEKVKASQGAPGWYPSESEPGLEWYWDGKSWTESRRVSPP